MRRRLLAATAIAVLAVVGIAGPAWAHVEIDPEEVVAGSTTTLTFNVEHGVNDQPTTELTIKLPDGAELASTPTLAGWTVAADDAAHTVTWSGGSAPAHEAFVVTMEVTLPDTAGEALFPTIQKGPGGQTDWIEEEESESEGAHPSPRVNVIASTATSGTETTETTVGSTTTNDLPDTTLEADQVDDGDQSPAPWLIGAGIAAILAIGIGGYLMKRRSDREKAETTGATRESPEDTTPGSDRQT